MRTPPDEKAQMWSQSSVCLSELVRREKWIDTLLNENKAGVESPLPASTSEWSNLLTAESNKKHFHVQFVSVKNRQCPIFATSSLPYFILNKTLFWKKNTKKVFTNLHCAVLHMHNTSHSHRIWTVIQLDTKCPDKKVFFFFFKKTNIWSSRRGLGVAHGKWVKCSTNCSCSLMPKAMPGESGPSWRRGAAKDKTLLQKAEERVSLWVLG